MTAPIERAIAPVAALTAVEPPQFEGLTEAVALERLRTEGYNEIASARYKVTGSWDKPDIVLIARNRTDNDRG